MFGIANGFKRLKGTALLLYSLALVMETLGYRTMALNMFNKVIQKAPQNRWLHIHASRICLKQGQVDMAVTHWKKAAGPEDIGCFIYWLHKSNRMPTRYIKKDTGTVAREAELETASPPQLPVTGTQDAGLELLEQGNADGALEVFFAELQSQGADPGLFFNTGVALSKLNKHEQALTYYEKAQKLGHNSLELLNNKGYSLFNLNRFEEAQTCYELARGMAPDDYTILNNLAACYAKTGQTVRACNSFAAAVEYNPDDAFLINNLSMCLEMCGKEIEALKNYDYALKLCRDNNSRNTILINKVNCLIRLKRFQEAIEACDQMFRDGSSSEFELWSLRAELLSTMGRASEATECYRKALGLAG